MQENWTAWFGIAAQWTPHWEPVPEGLRYETRWKPRSPNEPPPAPLPLREGAGGRVVQAKEPAQ